MAETVGRVQIIVDVNGRNIPLQIKRIEDEVAREADDAGKKFGDNFGDSFERSIRGRFQSSLQNALVTKNFDSFVKQFKDVDTAVDEAQRSMLALHEANQITDDQFGDFIDTLDEWKKAFDQKERLESNAIAWRKYEADQKATWLRIQQESADKLKQQERDWKNYESVQKTTWQNILKVRDQGYKAQIKNESDLWKIRNTTHAAYVKYLKEEEVAQKKLADARRRGGSDMKDLDFSFGSSSRNDFIHALGAMTEGIAELGQKAGHLMETFSEMPAAFKDAGGGFRGLQAAFSSLGGGSSALAASLPGLALGFLAVWAALGPLISGISLLVGGIIALTSAIAYGLTGALLAAAPAALALVGALAVVAVGVKNMSEKTKAAFKPLGKAWDDLAKKTSEGLFKDVPQQVKSMTDLLKTFVGPTMQGIARELSESWTLALQGLNSEKMRGPLKVLSDGLVSIAGALGDAFAKALPGIIAFFAPIMPYAVKLAEAIERIATQFSDWAQSVEGQNSIGSFMKTAWEAAKDLWVILGNVADIIGTVFASGEQSGKGFLESIKDVTGEFAAFLKSPEGQKQMQQWFEDAKKFADNLVTSIGQISAAILALDTPANRKSITTIVGLLGGIGEVITSVQKAMETGDASGGFARDMGVASREWIEGVAIPAIKEWGSSVAQAFTDARLAVGQWFTDMGRAISEWVASLGEQAGEIAAAVGAWFSGAWDTVSTSVSSWGTAISDWIGALPEHAGAIVEAVEDWFAQAGEAVVEWVTVTVPQFFSDLPNNILFALGAGASWMFTWLLTAYTDMTDWRDNTFFPFFTGLPGVAQEGLASAGNALGDWFSNMWNGAMAWWDGTAWPWITGLPQRALDAWNSGVNAISSWFSTMWQGMINWWNGTAQPWIAGIPGVVWAFLSSNFNVFTNWLSTSWQNAVNWWNGTAWPWIVGIPGRVGGALQGSTDFLAAWFRSAWTGVTGWWNGTAWPFISGLPGRIASAFGGIGSSIASGVGDAIRAVVNRVVDGINSFVNGWNSIALNPIKLPSMGHVASGRVLYGPEVVLAGEDGPEAIVPLRRNLGRVDPSVRALSAFAQGLPFQGGGGGQTINIEPGAIVVNSASQNPARIAESVLDRMAAAVH